MGVQLKVMGSTGNNLGNGKALQIVQEDLDELVDLRAFSVASKPCRKVDHMQVDGLDSCWFSRPPPGPLLFRFTPCRPSVPQACNQHLSFLCAEN